ncbi:MAG: mercury methylation corrinoid protein HgcA [Treponema sp.]|nr:mercury methylation corrinoid protein HgcA [Treponema sp.]
MSNCCKTEESSCCCGPKDTQCDGLPAVSTSLSGKDIFGACKVRWGIGRMDYKVEPGIYKVNNPDGSSPVLVSANYKLTFDTLRKNLADLDCWLLILNTKGVNVWCAAGEGTFGTDELVNRIEQTALADLVTHRKLILPQLGAPGVSAHEVTRRTGFVVVYGPVRAADVRAFIGNGYKATKEMRNVRFTFYDRLVLAPMEIAETVKIVLPAFGVLFVINLFAKRQFGIFDTTLYVGANLAGAFITPVLLPFIPGKAFSFKGWLAGLVWTAFAFWLFGWYAPGFWLLVAGYGFLLPAVSSFLAMNFTGASTYTSPSGVLKEMKIALPFIIGSAFLGAILVLIKSFVG